MASPDPESEPLPEPPGLRFLRLLVTVLTAVMIAGILGILGLIWSRYTNAQAPLPEVITLPDGATATAYTQGSDWYAVVVRNEDGEEIVIFDRATGRLRQTLRIAPR